jgi:hypothetical protein
MLAATLQDFQRFWYLEPEVLLSGDARMVKRIRKRAIALGIPFKRQVQGGLRRQLQAAAVGCWLLGACPLSYVARMLS